MKVIFVLSVAIAAIAALPAHDQVIRKMKLPIPSDLRYQYIRDDDGIPHLYDTWIKISDLEKQARFDPFRQNQYHLFTRANPTTSQPLVMGNAAQVAASNFNPQRKTVMIIHGFLGSATAPSNQALVPAYLAGEDVNIILVDWSAGNLNGNNAGLAAVAAAAFCDWLNFMTGASSSNYHIIGFSVGGQAAGIMSKLMNGVVSHIHALDPSAVWEEHDLIGPSDAAYVEVIHTSVSGWMAPLGDVDFYPNGGTFMPGCSVVNPICDHNMSYHYMAESLVSGGFTGTGCLNQLAANLQTCNLPFRLNMGGRHRKTGNFGTGIFHLRTNAAPPYSMG